MHGAVWKSSLNTAPSFITNFTFSSSVMSFNGSALTAMMSAYAPSATRPSSPLLPSISAGRSCRLNRGRRRHAEIHHPLEFRGNRILPGNAADVRAKDNFEVGLYGFAERRLVQMGARAIPLPFRRFGGCPVQIIDSEGRAIPRALLRHLRDLRVADVQAMFDGIAAAV